MKEVSDANAVNSIPNSQRDQRIRLRGEGERDCSRERNQNFYQKSKFLPSEPKLRRQLEMFRCTSREGGGIHSGTAPGESSGGVDKKMPTRKQLIVSNAKL